MSRCPNTTREHTARFYCTRTADHRGPCALELAAPELAPVESIAHERLRCPSGFFFALLLFSAAFGALGLAVYHLRGFLLLELLLSLLTPP